MRGGGVPSAIGKTRRGWRRIVGLVGLALLAGCSTPEARAPRVAETAGRIVEAQMFLSAKGPEAGEAIFDLPTGPWREARITLNSLEAQAMPARISCDGSGTLRLAQGRRGLGPGLSQNFTLPSRFDAPVTLALGGDVSACDLSWGEGRKLRLLPTEVSAPALAALDSRREACVVPPAGADPLIAAFYDNGALGQSCAQPIGAYELAPDAIDALNARFEALTGQRVSRAALLAGDPDMAIDFSRAPKLDLIVISYLHIRADLSGHLVRRMIEYHAARGTRVRILVSAGLMLDKDRRYWQGLAARYPGVQIQYFQWDDDGPGTPDDILDRLQRSNHSKLFLTLSAEPGRSRFITGGRNLHDGFFYDEIYDLSAHPELRTYTDSMEGLAWHTVYMDFELVAKDDALVRAVASHFAALWGRDGVGTAGLAMTRAGRVAPVPEDGVARHFMSYPWADGQALEGRYIQMIDAARREIVIVTPFLYPPEAIGAALERARARGVAVSIVTRQGSSDPPAFFTTALNHQWINAHLGRFRIWNYEPEGHLLHTKLMLIDGRLSVVSSTNFNARSFLHDTENGLVFLDRALTARLLALVESYRAGGSEITAPLPMNKLQRAFDGMTGLWQYF